MKLTIEQDNMYLPPIEITQYESVEVMLPNGNSIQVFSDVVYVRTEQNRRSRSNGTAVWRLGK